MPGKTTGVGLGLSQEAHLTLAHTEQHSDANRPVKLVTRFGEAWMMHFKQCPRCRTGDVTVEKDLSGWYALCIHCGFVKDLRDPTEAKVVLRSDGHRRPTVSTVA